MEKDLRKMGRFGSKFERFLQKFAGLKIIIVLAVLIILVNLFLFPFFMPSGEGLIPLDMMFAYDPDDSFRMIEAYGEEGRQSYFWGLLLIDFIYPVLYSLFLGLLLYLIYKKPLASMIPLSILVADYAENAGIIIMLSLYPERMQVLAVITSMITTIKWVLAGITGLAIILGFISMLRRRK